MQPQRRNSHEFRYPGKQISRRWFLEATLGAGGAGLALGDILRLRAEGAEAGQKPPDTSVIQIWLGGGPSQFETFDPKPNAPIEIRGPYEAIQTALPGALVCEKLPLTAKVFDKTALIKSFTHAFDDHFGLTHWCLAGRKEPDSRNQYPSLGAIASKFRGPRQAGMPGYVLLCEDPVNHFHLFEALGPGYLGVGHAPFTVMQDPYKPEFQHDRLRRATDSLILADDITLERINDRQALRSRFDRLPRLLEANPAGDQTDAFTRLALEMVTSAKARRAFDLNQESPATHERYGKHMWGQMALLARRLVEAGVTFVTIDTGPDCLRWDWHQNIVREPRNEGEVPGAGPLNGMDVNGPPLDRALAALIADLSERDLCRNTLLVVWGEFGRSPRVNQPGGRDHWPPLGSVLLASGGLKMGQIIGESDKNGGTPTARPIGPSDVLATLYRHLGIDPRATATNLQGRPIELLPDGKVIEELF